MNDEKREDVIRFQFSTELDRGDAVNSNTSTEENTNSNNHKKRGPRNKVQEKIMRRKNKKKQAAKKAAEEQAEMKKKAAKESVDVENKDRIMKPYIEIKEEEPIESLEEESIDEKPTPEIEDVQEIEPVEEVQEVEPIEEVVTPEIEEVQEVEPIEEVVTPEVEEVQEVEPIEEVVTPEVEEVQEVEPIEEVVTPEVEEVKPVEEVVTPEVEEVKPVEEVVTPEVVEEVKVEGAPVPEPVQEEKKPEEKDPIIEEVKEALEDKPSAKEIHDIRRIYIGFQTRVVLLIIGILILFGAACFIIVSTLQKNEVRQINYIEKSNVHYDVCQISENPYNTSCLKEGNTYSASTASKMHIDYHYEAQFDEDIDYDLSYHVVVVHKIFDRYDSNKVSYEDEDLIKDKEKIISKGNPASLDVSVEIDYQKYHRFVEDFKKKYASNADATLNVILYVDDGSETRNVGSVIIPLASESFDIVSIPVSNSKQVYYLEEKNWTNTSTLYIVVGSIFVLLSLFLLFHLTKLVLAITGKKSKYQEYLMSILNEYDRLIVIARDGFETNVEKKVIKVYTFAELLDARSILNKPIVYSRINNVKSEFIVEDEEVIYKFVLKEADMGE